jgi:hypothetical protein
MSKVYTDTVTSTEASQDLTLGGSGDNVIVTAGATLKTNTIKDSGGNTLWTSDGSGNLSSVNAALKGNITLLSTQTASNAASVSFTSGIDSTYKLYIFKLINIHPASVADFTWQANAAGGSGFNETITSSTFRTYHTEAGNAAAFGYNSSADQAQGTAYQWLGGSVNEDNDEAASGELFLFNPSNTTYVKHFYSTLSYVLDSGGPLAYRLDAAGYINTTSAIDEIDFKMSSGNMDGVIKMYGVG